MSCRIIARIAPFVSSNIYFRGVVNPNFLFLPWRCTGTFIPLAGHKLFDCPSPQPPFCQHLITRTYAKGKDKKKGDSKGKKKVHINDEELSEVIQVDNMKHQMQKQLENLRDEFVRNLSIRSSAGSLENLRIKIDGQEATLQEVAQIARKNPKTIVINFSSFPQAIPAALQAIQKSGMNLNPQQDGTTVFVPVPVVTREHRENLARNAKALFIKCRDGVKDVQNKFIRNVKKNNEISEDLSHDVQQQIVAIGDQYVEQADKMLQTKTVELLGKDA